MRAASTPAWVFVMLIGIGLMFVAGGVVSVVLSGAAPASVVFAAIWLLMGGAFVSFAVRGIMNHHDEDRIRRYGTPATATLLSAKKTGWYVNGLPQWALRVRIDGAGASYETTLKLQTRDAAPNGATVAVLIDPWRRGHVVLPGGGGAAPNGDAAIVTAFRQAGLRGPETTTVVDADRG